MRWIALLLLLVAHGALGETLRGKVVRIADGDTLTILVNKTQIRVRLDAIDAPERGRAFGRSSSLAGIPATRKSRNDGQIQSDLICSRSRATW